MGLGGLKKHSRRRQHAKVAGDVTEKETEPASRTNCARRRGVAALRGGVTSSPNASSAGQPARSCRIPRLTVSLVADGDNMHLRICKCNLV